MGHPVSFSEPLPKRCLGGRVRKSSGPDKKKTKTKTNKQIKHLNKKIKEGKTKWKEREES